MRGRRAGRGGPASSLDRPGQAVDDPLLQGQEEDQGGDHGQRRVGEDADHVGGVPGREVRDAEREGLQLVRAQQQEREQLREQVLVRVLLFYRKRPEQQQRSERPERRSSSFQIS